MAFIEFLARWPAWYLVLAAYTIYVGIEKWMYARHLVRHVTPNVPEAVKHSEAFVAGARARAFAPAVIWIVAGLSLLTGSDIVRVALLLLFVKRATVVQRDYATGFAEGRKSVELAAAWEYVRGRIQPRAPDRAAGVVFATVTCLVPAFGLLAAVLWL